MHREEFRVTKAITRNIPADVVLVRSGSLHWRQAWKASDTYHQNNKKLSLIVLIWQVLTYIRMIQSGKEAVALCYWRCHCRSISKYFFLKCSLFPFGGSRSPTMVTSLYSKFVPHFSVGSPIDEHGDQRRRLVSGGFNLYVGNCIFFKPVKMKSFAYF